MNPIRHFHQEVLDLEKLVNVGFGNTVPSSRIVAIVSANSAPLKRLKDEAKQDRKLIDATNGRRTRSIIITDSGHVILSAVQTETIVQRLAGDENKVRPE
jgi:extracellular matrix regulatory protein A